MYHLQLDTPNGVYYSPGEAVTNSSSGTSAPLTTHLEGKSISSLQISVTDDGTGDATLGNIMLSVIRCLSVQTEGKIPNLNNTCIIRSGSIRIALNVCGVGKDCTILISVHAQH